MDIVISIVSLTVIATVTIILLYQNASVRDNVAANMQSVVDQINDSTYYGYQYDKRQEDNIKNLDKNINTVSKDVKNIVDEVKNIKLQTPTNIDISKNLQTKNVSTGSLKLGQKFSLSGEGADEWLRLNNAEGTQLYGGLAASKLYSHNGASFKGNTTADNLSISNSFQVKGGKSEHNPGQLQTILYGPDGLNYIRGDTELRGNTNNIGDLKVGKTLHVQNGINTFRSDLGPVLKNTTRGGVEFGAAHAQADNYQIYNSSAQGGIQLGFGKDAAFEPAVDLRKRSLTIGAGGNRLSIAQNASDEFNMKSSADKAMTFQTGSKPPMVFNNGALGIGGPNQHGTLDVYGNIASRGTDFVLGVGNNDRGDTKSSRAMVKGPGSELVLNFDNDFAGGITSHSDFKLLPDKCIETGKGAKLKEVNAGKVCYQKFSDGLDIVGAGEAGKERKVRLWDQVETSGLKANKLCLGNTCINEDDLNKILKTDGNFCLGQTCLQEPDMQNIKNLGNQIKTKRIDIGTRWTIQPEGPNDSFIALRDNTSGGDKRYSFPANKYVTF